MNTIMKIVTIATLLSSNSYVEAMQTAQLTVQTINQNNIIRQSGHCVLDQALYTAGGTLFTYPTNLFTQAPTVNLAIQAAAHADTLTYTVEIVSNNAVSATIMVYKISNEGTVEQAATNEVTIHIEASGL